MGMKIFFAVFAISNTKKTTFAAPKVLFLKNILPAPEMAGLGVALNGATFEPKKIKTWQKKSAAT
jgi:hypothetical protein